MNLDPKQIATFKERCTYAATHGFLVAHADHYAAALALIAGVAVPAAVDAAQLVALCNAAEKALREGKPAAEKKVAATPSVAAKAIKKAAAETPKPVEKSVEVKPAPKPVEAPKPVVVVAPVETPVEAPKPVEVAPVVVEETVPVVEKDSKES